MLLEFAGFSRASHLGIRSESRKVQAVKFVRKMRGKSQAFLLQCSNEMLYVVKNADSEMGSNILANEVIGSECLRAIGLPTPEWQTVFVSKEFIDQNPEMCFETTTGKKHIQEGIHFGSMFLGEEETGDLFEYLPSSFHSRVNNPRDFIGMYIFDIWANHCDCRQPIFLKDKADNTLKAFFIDNGHLFGGPTWSSFSRPGEALCVDLRVYSLAWSKSMIDHWVTHIKNNAEKGLSEVLERIPQAWCIGDIRSLIDHLRARLMSLESLVWRDLEQIRGFRSFNLLQIGYESLSLQCNPLLLDGDLINWPTTLDFAS